jgi:uncharacterized RDD family membrane protein YckC
VLPPALTAANAPLDTDVAIETPEHIVFRHRVAGPARRFIAFLLDIFICYTAFSIVAVIVLVAAVGAGAVTDTISETAGAGAGLLLVLLFGLQWVYFALLEGWRGTTPGKAALGMRVVTTTGRPIGFRQSALRNVLRAADALPLTYTVGLFSIAGLFSMGSTRRFQRLGDLVAGTIVIIPERTFGAAPLMLWPPAQPQELATLPEVVRLDADERQAIEMFLRRRVRLGRPRELELAAMIAPALCARYGLRHPDPSRALALLYDRAANAGRTDAPPSSRTPGSWR